MMYAYSPLVGFKSEKAAQISAFFLLRSGGEIEKLKLIKLMYLSERESVIRRGRLIIFDEYYSLKDGPICSSALNAINGGIDKDVWSKYIHKDGRKNIYLVSGCSQDSLDRLSEYDIDILSSIWEQFGWMSASQIRNWTHDNCPEYIEIEKGRLPISLNSMAQSVGLDPADDLEKSVAEYRAMEAVFSE